MTDVLKSIVGCDCFKKGQSKKKKVQPRRISKLKKHVDEVSEEEVKKELSIQKSPKGSSSLIKQNSALMTPVKRASKVFKGIQNDLAKK